MLPRAAHVCVNGRSALTCPYPTSTPTTLAAPLCSRQSANPPVDTPASNALKPRTSTLKWSNAASSLRPALHGAAQALHQLLVRVPADSPIRVKHDDVIPAGVRYKPFSVPLT